MPENWLPKAGECLLIDSGPTGKHLFIILLVFRSSTIEQVISVPVCTVRDQAKADPACRIQSGEHPFVVHESFVEYRHARLDQADHVLDRVKELTFIPQQPASATLLTKAREGLKNSAFVKRYLKDTLALHLT